MTQIISSIAKNMTVIYLLCETILSIRIIHAVIGLALSQILNAAR
jgi:hypothetical protein